MDAKGRGAPILISPFVNSTRLSEEIHASNTASPPMPIISNQQYPAAIEKLAAAHGREATELPLQTGHSVRMY